MSTSFTNTRQSLKADNFYPSIIGLTCVIVIGLAWGVWFFLAPVAQYEISQTVRIRGEVITTRFSPEIVEQLTYSSGANLRVTTPQNSHLIPLIVMELNPATGLVELTPQAEGDLNYLTQPANGQVEIVTNYVSPATLVLQAAGLH